MTLSWNRIGFGPIRKLEINAIDPSDRTFDIFRIRGDLLTKSLQIAGMATPIMVDEIGEHKFRILSGFHRYETAFSLHWTHIPARILRGKESCWTACQHIFWIKTYRNDPHLVEWAGIVRIAKLLNQSPRSALHDTLTPLGFPLSDYLFSLIIKLSDFPIELNAILLRYPLSFRQVERFVLLTPEILIKLAAWGEILRMRTQELLEVGEQLDAFHRQVPQNDQSSWFREVEMRIVDSDLPRDERLHYLKDRLDDMVRPTLQMYRRKKRDAHRQLTLPSGMAVTWDEDLEREDVTLSLTIKNPSDLYRFQKTLMDPSFKRGVEKLLKSHE